MWYFLAALLLTGCFKEQKCRFEPKYKNTLQADMSREWTCDDDHPRAPIQFRWR
jgi:hypothetical protein